MSFDEAFIVHQLNNQFNCTTQYSMQNSTARTAKYGRQKGTFRTRDQNQNLQLSELKSRAFIEARRRVDFDPKEFMVAECSEQEIMIYKQAFDFLDDDHDEMLTPMDLRKAMLDYGEYKPDRTFVYKAMAFFDENNGGEISFKEFVKVLTQKPCQSDTIDDIQSVFESMDEGSKGYLTVEDIEEIARGLDERVTKAEIDEVIRNCDPDGEGVITLAAFISFNQRKNFN